jgi:cytochrome P450
VLSFLSSPTNRRLTSFVPDGILPSPSVSLPFVDRQLSRVITALPGLPHRLMQDDVYNGMFIPKGTMVLANLLFVPMSTRLFRMLTTQPISYRSMARDESVYADPTSFHPERFLPKSVGGSEEPYPTFSFGFGRR